MTLLPMVPDHTREYIPVLMYPKIDKYHELSGDSTFSSIGATIADNFNVNYLNLVRVI